MEKNSIIALVLSTLVLVLWFTYFQPSRPARTQAQSPATAAAENKTQSGPAETPAAPQEIKAAPARLAENAAIPEQDVVVENETYRAVFTNRGAAIKHWYLKERNGAMVDLILDPDAPALANFPGSNYQVSRQASDTVVFTHVSPQGWQVKKTYVLSNDYMHTVSLETTRLSPVSPLPPLEMVWGSGLGTDIKEQKENAAQTRAIAFHEAKPRKLEKFKTGEYAAGVYSWAAIDNRYFLAAVIPQEGASLKNVSVYRGNKKQPVGMTVTMSSPAADSRGQALTFKLYLGPKGMQHLKALNLGLEESIDFGFFGFLGKIALNVLLFFHKMTGNYGWAIIILTLIIQMLTLPLTLKSFKASAAMKQLQPLIKELQTKYKNDPRRMNAEMMNLYKTQKVNPLGGCLPMLLQLPIFWALFTTLRNAYELRNAPWIMWVKDLSAPDTFMYAAGFPLNILPLIMGVGMFFQQKMMTATTDPAQAKLMYIMPVVFTFMFWGFPSGLVLYWLTNSIVSMIEQYVILKRQPAADTSLPRIG